MQRHNLGVEAVWVEFQSSTAGKQACQDWYEDQKSSPIFGCR